MPMQVFRVRLGQVKPYLAAAGAYAWHFDISTRVLGDEGAECSGYVCKRLMPAQLEKQQPVGCRFVIALTEF